MKRFYAFLFTVITVCAAFAQGEWKLDFLTDDYTMEKEYVLLHYTSDILDAVYYPNDTTLKIIKDYKGLEYFDTCWEAAVENSGRIPASDVVIHTRLIFSEGYKEKSAYKTIYYNGFGDDSKIDTKGFYSSFYLQYTPEDLKKANYVTFKYYDKIIKNTRVIKLSLAGFTRCISRITQ